MKHFAIGCFHFAVKTPIVITLQDYLDRIKSSLEKINAINNIKVYVDDDVINPDFSIEIDEVVDPLNKSGYLAPMIRGMKVSFDVYIPERIQREVFYRGTKCKTDRFKVYVSYMWHGPFAIVECVNPEPSCEPSDAVCVVREFLKKYLSDEIIRFETLGPSPFHADFHIKTRDDKLSDNDIAYEVIDKKGYSRVEFECPPTSSLDDCFYYIMHESSFEASLYYSIISRSRIRSNKWNELHGDIINIIDNMPHGYFKQSIYRIRNSYEVDRLVTDAISFKMFDIDLEKEISDDIKFVYSNNDFIGVLKSFINREHDEFSIYPEDELIDIAKYLSERRNKTYETMFILISAIIGGAIGSLLTVVSKHI